MGIGFDAAKQLISSVENDPTTARAELADAVNALQAVLAAFDRAEKAAQDAYIAKVLASYAPERDASLKAAMASARAALEAVAAGKP
jgi:hypothetical protein